MKTKKLVVMDIGLGRFYGEPEISKKRDNDALGRFCGSPKKLVTPKKMVNDYKKMYFQFFYLPYKQQFI